MSDVVFRQGNLVLLRPLERKEISLMRQWMNDPEVTTYLGRILPLYEKEEEEWFENIHKRTNDLVLGIVARKEKKLIGSMGLHQIHWSNRTAVTGTVIGNKSYWSKGYGSEAKMLLLDFAFNALDLQVILSRALSTNQRSIAYSKKCGYKEVGRIPQWIRHQSGARCDEVLLAVTQEEWRPLWQHYLKNKKVLTKN
jgi:RimJ/RimL family protein N-acetyltransferase